MIRLCKFFIYLERIKLYRPNILESVLDIRKLRLLPTKTINNTKITITNHKIIYIKDSFNVG